jgi:hypothetical protein
MSIKQPRISSINRVKLTMFFSSMAATISQRTLDDLRKLSSDYLQCPVAESTIKETLKAMELRYKPLVSSQTRAPRGTLQRDTLRAVCTWIAQFDQALPESSPIRRFIKQ